MPPFLQLVERDHEATHPLSLIRCCGSTNHFFLGHFNKSLVIGLFGILLRNGGWCGSRRKRCREREKCESKLLKTLVARLGKQTQGEARDKNV